VLLTAFHSILVGLCLLFPSPHPYLPTVVVVGGWTVFHCNRPTYLQGNGEVCVCSVVDCTFLLVILG
jgi:hypothetical protein